MKYLFLVLVLFAFVFGAYKICNGDKVLQLKNYPHATLMCINDGKIDFGEKGYVMFISHKHEQDKEIAILLKSANSFCFGNIHE